MAVRVIGLSGPAGAGKSTVARALRKVAAPVIVEAFAAPLKAMLTAFYEEAEGYDFDVDARLGGELKGEPCELLCGATPRWAMQSLGTEWGRELIGPEIWVGHWRRRLQHVIDDPDWNLIVADDVRFEDEATAVRALGGIVVEVERPGVGRGSAHLSEAGVAADRVLLNDGTPEAAAARLLEIIGGGA